MNKKLKLDSYKNETHHMACQKNECAKISSICSELLLRKLLRKFVTGRHTHKGKTVYPLFFGAGVAGIK
jgi:hypothetical protein